MDFFTHGIMAKWSRLRFPGEREHAMVYRLHTNWAFWSLCWHLIHLNSSSAPLTGRLKHLETFGNLIHNWQRAPLTVPGHLWSPVAGVFRDREWRQRSGTLLPDKAAAPTWQRLSSFLWAIVVMFEKSSGRASAKRGSRMHRESQRFELLGNRIEHDRTW